jgi:hypothetical protein
MQIAKRSFINKKVSLAVSDDLLIIRNLLAKLISANHKLGDVLVAHVGSSF